MQSFSEIPLSTPISKAIADLGYEKPSPIQAQTLPLLLAEPTDFIGLAATGTGKTAAFAIPLLEKIEVSASGVQALILCPTRELALQVASQINLIGRYKRVRSVAVYGGASYADQIRGLRDGAQVVVGTPGRVVDHVERGTLKLSGLKTIILDEADEMISMGFKDELEKILAAVPREHSNIWLFSATMSREVRKVADTYLRSPKQVQVNRDEILSATVEQYYYPTQESNKSEILCKLIEGAENFYGLIFCQTKALVIDLTQYLSDRGYKVDSLHGDKDQTSRERTMQAFRNRKITILVCTDVASRGLDVKDITHVVNYSLPRELENYVHRIGRTARSGKTGVAMNLVTPSHRRLIFAIENLTKSRMIEGRIPTRREIGARKVASRLQTFLDQQFHARAVEVMNEDWKAALTGMTAEEVAGRFLTSLLPDVFNDPGMTSKTNSARVPAANSSPRLPLPVTAEAKVGAAAAAAVTTPKPAFKPSVDAPALSRVETETETELASEPADDSIAAAPVVSAAKSAAPHKARSFPVAAHSEDRANVGSGMRPGVRSAPRSRPPALGGERPRSFNRRADDGASRPMPASSEPVRRERTRSSSASPFVAPRMDSVRPTRAPSRSGPRPHAGERGEVSAERPARRFDRGVEASRPEPRKAKSPSSRFSEGRPVRARANAGEITRELVKRAAPKASRQEKDSASDESSAVMNRRARRALKFAADKIESV